MKVFQDRQGRSWEVELKYSTMKRCRDVAGIDLAAVMTDAELLQRLFLDPLLVADVVCEICHAQREREKLTHDEFCDAVMAVSPDARQAVIDELHDFFRRCQMDDHCALIVRGRETMEKMLSQARTKMEAQSVDALVAELTAKAS